MTTVAAALWLLAPTAVPAKHRHQSGSTSANPAELAVTGGAVTLRAPGSRMLRVPAGKFSMGSSQQAVIRAVVQCQRQPFRRLCEPALFAHELPAHQVKLSSFWLDRNEVSVRDYRRCVAARRCRAAPFSEGGRRFDRPNLPVTLVSHADAVDYCRFRGGRLPTEAEWERAARGPAGRTYPWGKFYNSRVANHGRFGYDVTDASDGFAELAPVGSFPSGNTPQGFADLAGNAAEWVADRYGAYPEEPVINPKGPARAVGPARVIRGGHFGRAAPWMRGASRSAADAATRTPYIGFRCARTGRQVAAR